MHMGPYGRFPNASNQPAFNHASYVNGNGFQVDGGLSQI